MRLEILEKLTGHLGITKCRERAMQSVWWPRLRKQLYDLIYMCRKCTHYRLNRAEPLITSEFPERPWQNIAPDMFELNGKQYVIAVDYYSRYFEVAVLQQTTAKTVIGKLKQFFASHGSPEIVFSDNGPQYACAEFKQFTHITSSPKYPQSNGEAERAVKTAKCILKKSQDPWLGIQAYCATKLAANGYTPAQLLFGRNIRTPVPCLESNLMLECVNIDNLKKRETKYRKRQETNFNFLHKVVELDELEPGSRVWIKDAGQGDTGRYTTFLFGRYHQVN